MRIAFDCASYHQGPPEDTAFIHEIYGRLGKCYLDAGHKCQVVMTGKGERFWNEKIEADFLFLWNGSYVAALNRVPELRKQGVLILYSEVGWLPHRQDTFYFDSLGVNAASGIGRWRPQRPLNQTEKGELDAALIPYWQDTLFVPVKESEYVFLPLQCEDDSQIELYSPFKTMQAFVDYARGWTDRPIVIKTHPGEPQIADSLQIPDNAKLVDGNLYGWLRNALCVLTINSNTGLEAIAHKKIVMPLGDSFWAQALKGGLRVLDPQKSDYTPFLHYLVCRRQWNLTDLTPDRMLALLDGKVEK